MQTQNWKTAKIFPLTKSHFQNQRRGHLKLSGEIHPVEQLVVVLQLVFLFVVKLTVCLISSELLQDLDLCDNDPVAVARCFVLKASVSPNL